MNDTLDLFKRYCNAFGLVPCMNEENLSAWINDCGPIVAGAFDNTGLFHAPPIVYVTPTGEIIVTMKELTGAVECGRIEEAIRTSVPLHEE
jgi:hypothetical protein